MDGNNLITSSSTLQRLLLLVFPKLGSWPVADWSKLLRDCRSSEPDAIERVGLVASLIITVGVLESKESEAPSFYAIFVEQFLIAIPILMVLFGPFYVRRIRIALDVFHRDEGKMGVK
jgi:hypothetical protein